MFGESLESQEKTTFLPGRENFAKRLSSRRVHCSSCKHIKSALDTLNFLSVRNFSELKLECKDFLKREIDWVFHEIKDKLQCETLAILHN